MNCNRPLFPSQLHYAALDAHVLCSIFDSFPRTPSSSTDAWASGKGFMMYMYMYVHVHTYIHTHTYIRTHTPTYIHIHVHTYIYMCTHTYTYAYIHIHIHIHMYVHATQKATNWKQARADGTATGSRPMTV